jgi:hypothetical protein
VLVLSPWGAKERQTLATGTGLVRAREVVVIDRYVGMIVHESVPGCRPHPRSTERSFNWTGFGRCASGEPGLVALVQMDALHVAAVSGDVEEVITLVEEGADVEAVDAGGWRALHLAASEGHTEVAVTLLEAVADVEAELASGERPLFIAAQRGHVEVARTLLEAGADVDAQNAAGFMPLFIAAQRGHVEVARTLLEAGADVEAQMPRGRGRSTARHNTGTWRWCERCWRLGQM